VEKKLGHKGPTWEAPPFPQGGGGGANSSRGGVILILHTPPPHVWRPKEALSPLVAAPSPLPILYILEDFDSIGTQVLEPPLVNLVLVLVGPS
jgi:hypothetical protein